MSTQPQFYALFVGIDNYRSPNVTGLRGCVNDVTAMARFVTAKLNLPEANIRLYTANDRADETPDKLASRANILAGFEWLTGQASAKDQVFIHYSGHGSQAPTVDPNNEPDGLDETLVPCDSRMVGPDGRQVYDVLDKEIKTYIDLIEASGAYVTVFFDCCHSGSGTRGEQKVLTRKTPEDSRTRSLDTLETRTATRLAEQIQLPPQPVTASGWHITGGHVLLAGCRDEQLSHEYRDPESGAWHGATTYFLLRALRSADDKTTWGQVYDQVRTAVNAQYTNQMPQLEGPANRAIFGGLTVPAHPHLLVEKVESDPSAIFVHINGGPPVGLNVGSRIELYPPGSDLNGQPLARGVVDAPDMDTVGYVWARVTAPPADGVVPALSRVKISAQSYDNLVYPVAAADELVRAALIKVNAEGEAESITPFLKLMEIGDDAGAIFRVEVQGDHFVVQDAAGVQVVVDTPPHSEEGAQQVAKYLEHLAVYNNVRNLRNPSINSRLADALKVEAFSYSRAGRSRPEDGIVLDNRDAVVEPGRKIWLSVKNVSGEDLYVSVLDLNPDFGIKRLYPRNSSYQKVAAGGELFEPNIRYPINNPFAGRSQAAFKVFVTRQPMSFDVLQLEDLNEAPLSASTRSLDANNPLSRLLSGVRSQGTRGGAVIDDAPDDLWYVQQIEFTVLADHQAKELPPGATSVEIGSPLEMTLTKPAGFTGQIVASSVGQVTRSADVDATLAPPPGLSSGAAAEMFVPLTFASGTRSAIGSPGVLAVNASPDELAQISEENPLRLELTLDEEEDLQGVLPIAFDGQHYFLAGQIDEATTGARDANRRRVALSITHLPLPADAAPGGGTRTAGDAPTRDLKRTARLFFYKVYRKELPADTGVRRPLFNPDQTPVKGADGKPSYVPATPADLSGAKRAALLIHGFTSDTTWLVEKAWPRLGKLADYDLVLTYDYESFNTGMGENGALLAQALTGLGFGPDDGIHLDIFCHSMGTQVARAMVELEGGHVYTDRVFLAGAPNAGTRVADAKSAIFWAGTILLNQTGLEAPTVIANWFLKKALDSAVSVGDLMPGSELYKKLNSGTAPLGVKYYVQIGTNKPLDGGVDWNTLFSKAGLAKAFDKGLDALLGPNDLLVGVASAKAVRNGHWPNLKVAELDGHHFQYFWTDESVAKVAEWMAE